MSEKEPVSGEKPSEPGETKIPPLDTGNSSSLLDEFDSELNSLRDAFKGFMPPDTPKDDKTINSNDAQND